LDTQCPFRTPEARNALLERYPDPVVARAAKKLAEARRAFGSQGLKAFVVNPLESPEFSELMGGIALWPRLAGDSMHLVRETGPMSMQSLTYE
jgi:hypothetical protein